MRLRTAQLSDVVACGALDASYTTEHTWQVNEERPLRPGALELSVTLRAVRLPRPRSVVPPDATPELEAEWSHADLFVVVEEEDVPTGYLCARAEPEGAWVRRLVVDKPRRRSGVATTLLGAAREWAAYNGLGRLLVAVPTRNHPAICLFRSRGYTICGYNERHFRDGEIAIYLAHEAPVTAAE
jgi:GNAT superfamily N-acetyltransferase